MGVAGLIGMIVCYNKFVLNCSEIYSSLADDCLFLVTSLEILESLCLLVYFSFTKLLVSCLLHLMVLVVVRNTSR